MTLAEERTLWARTWRAQRQCRTWRLIQQVVSQRHQARQHAHWTQADCFRTLLASTAIRLVDYDAPALWTWWESLTRQSFPGRHTPIPFWFGYIGAVPIERVLTQGVFDSVEAWIARGCPKTEEQEEPVMANNGGEPLWR